MGLTRNDFVLTDDELNKLVENYGLSVANVTVPNVSLSPEVQALLDSITKSRLETEKAVQDKLRATAEASCAISG